MAEWLRANTQARQIGVDREAGIIHGVILAQEGPFHTQGRGEFDVRGIKRIVSLAKQSATGLKSRFMHPDASNDGLGKFLGRTKNVHLGFIQSKDGKELSVARGDMHFAASASKTPNGDLAGYLMDLASEDSDALGMSLALKVDEELRLEKNGTPKVNEAGEMLPPLWMPTVLHAVDFVDQGDATDSLLGQSLSIDGLPDEVVRQAEMMLRKQFAGKDRTFVEQHLSDWTARVLAHYWPEGEESEGPSAADLERHRRHQRRNRLTCNIKSANS